MVSFSGNRTWSPSLFSPCFQLLIVQFKYSRRRLQTWSGEQTHDYYPFYQMESLSYFYCTYNLLINTTFNHNLGLCFQLHWNKMLQVSNPDALLQVLCLEDSCNCISLEEHTWVTQKLSIKLSEVVIWQLNRNQSASSTCASNAHHSQIHIWPVQ